MILCNKQCYWTPSPTKLIQYKANVLSVQNIDQEIHSRAERHFSLPLNPVMVVEFYPNATISKIQKTHYISYNFIWVETFPCRRARALIIGKWFFKNFIPKLENSLWVSDGGTPLLDKQYNAFIIFCLFYNIFIVPNTLSSPN